MAWSASTLYAQATPSLLAVLSADPVLGPHLHHIRRFDRATFPGRSMQHSLPPGGLLAIPDVYAPDDGHPSSVPSDALHGPPSIHLAFPPAERLAPHLDPRHWPPPAALRKIKHLAFQACQPISWYVCVMWGGDIEWEAAWLPGWRPGEPDRLICHAGRGTLLVSTGRTIREFPGDVLIEALEYHRLRLPSPYFAPHTGGFAWDAHRVHPAQPLAVPSQPSAVLTTSHSDGYQISTFPGSDGLPPLHPQSLYSCVLHGDADRVRTLLAAGADPNIYTHTTPLALAAGALCDDLLRVSLHKTNRHAAAHGRPRSDIVDLLLAAGADPMPPGHRTALHEVADVACAERLLAAGVPIDGFSPVHTPLTLAAGRGLDAVASFLVDRGAALQPADHPFSVWFAACTGGLLWLVDALLAAGLDPRTPELPGTRTGLEHAASHGHADVALRLLAAGCALTDATWKAACRGGSVPLIDLHLAAGHAIDLQDHGLTLLALAVRERHPAAALRLLAAGADPSRPSHGETPLYLAAWNDVPGVIDEILARCPAARETPDDNGWTPLFAAAWSGHAACAAKLLAHGASLDVTDASGRTLRDAAVRGGLVLPTA